jgi:peptide/nickel transport system substrate-binding protein
MSQMTRRVFLAGGAALAAGAVTAPAVRAQKKGGVLRFVPHADLKILDPIWTTAYITRNHGYLIYDTLFATDANLKIQPQMVDRFTVSLDKRKWSFTLRDGLRFHDGQPVTAEDAVVSIKRWGARDTVGRLFMASIGKFAATDRKTFALELETPFGLVLEALGKPSSNVPFIMPARLASTDPNEQVKEAIGSGPYKFVKDEWQPGNKVVYARNGDYVPRKEKPSGAAGGKLVHVDRLEWRYIPDQATASSALEAREVDYWENIPLDFVPRLEKNAGVTVFVTDPRGSQGCLRPNHLHPPFNNKKARQALLYMVDQKTYLEAVIGNAKYFQTCPAIFMCGGTPFETNVGAPKQDLDRARQLLKESGYDGRPLVVLDPTDSPYAHAPALVTAELLRKIGATVDIQAMDWSTMVARRAKKDPVGQGGWNVFHTWATGLDVVTPAVNAWIGGAGDKAWFGWPTIPEMEKLRAEFTRTPDAARQKQIVEQIQQLTYDEVPYVPWGQFVVPNAFRKNVQGVLQFGATLLWNVSV